MNNSAYIEKLNDKRWIRKRNRIFKRDKYRCTACGGKENIQVHHNFYYSDYRDPWLYPDDSLLTVCRKCHLEFHEHHETETRDIKKKSKKNKPKKKKRIKKGRSLADQQLKQGLRIKLRKRDI